MSTKPSTWQSHYYLIFLHSTESRILLLHEQNSWLLPSFHTVEPGHISNAFLIIDTTLRQLGIDAIEYLRKILPLSQMLATIHQAVSYQHMVAHMEGTSKQAMRGGATFWLRILLQLWAEMTW